MQSHVIPILRWLWQHRYEITLGAALVFVVALSLLVTPLLLAFAAIEWKQRPRGRKRNNRLLGLLLLARLAHVSHLLWRKLWHIPRWPWHPCAQCGAAIEEPSRAAYCSHVCRTYARLEREALDTDPRIADRAERRLRNLRYRELVDADPRLHEVPF
jgi:hypothetical protein